jgi:hypothetical protein
MWQAEACLSAGSRDASSLRSERTCAEPAGCTIAVAWKLTVAGGMGRTSDSAPPRRTGTVTATRPLAATCFAFQPSGATAMYSRWSTLLYTTPLDRGFPDRLLSSSSSPTLNCVNAPATGSSKRGMKYLSARGRADAADLVILDLWLASDAAEQGTSSTRLLRYYLSAEKPVVGLSAQHQHTRLHKLFLESRLVLLEWPPDQRNLCETVRSLLPEGAGHDLSLAQPTDEGPTASPRGVSRPHVGGGRRSMLALEVNEMNEMFMVWLIALVVLVVLLLVVAAVAPRGDRQDRPPMTRHDGQSRRDSRNREGRKAA